MELSMILPRMVKEAKKFVAERQVGSPSVAVFRVVARECGLPTEGDEFTRLMEYTYVINALVDADFMRAAGRLK